MTSVLRFLFLHILQVLQEVEIYNMQYTPSAAVKMSQSKNYSFSIPAKESTSVSTSAISHHELAMGGDHLSSTTSHKINWITGSVQWSIGLPPPPRLHHKNDTVLSKAHREYTK